MDIFILTSPSSARFAFAATVLLVASTATNAADPKPKPTPKPGTLGAYAKKITLDRSTLGEENGRVILTNDNIVILGAGGSIIDGVVATDGRRKPKPAGVADNAERARWRAAYRKQRNEISSLEGRRSQLVIEIDLLENQSLTIKTMARLQRLETKLEQLDRDIASERTELARIVRDARKRGAEPGWFR
jgi:hypothetical protein